MACPCRCRIIAATGTNGFAGLSSLSLTTRPCQSEGIPHPSSSLAPSRGHVHHSPSLFLGFPYPLVPFSRHGRTSPFLAVASSLARLAKGRKERAIKRLPDPGTTTRHLVETSRARKRCHSRPRRAPRLRARRHTAPAPAEDGAHGAPAEPPHRGLVAWLPAPRPGCCRPAHAAWLAS
jgi:hypothetical protein